MKKQSHKIWAIVAAAGAGRRMGVATPKQYLKLGPQTVLQHSLHAITADPRITAVMVAISSNDQYWQAPALDIPIYTTEGGKERCDSVLKALQALSSMAANDDWVLVHDAARPCLSQQDLSQLIDQVYDDAVGGILAIPVSDTIKKANDDQSIQRTIDRTHLWRALTPQMFPYGLLKAALIDALKQGINITDEASAMEHHHHQPRLIEGHNSNLKITQHEDLELARYYLDQQGRI